jgi:hypothetical protein
MFLKYEINKQNMIIKPANIKINYITTCQFIVWSYAKELMCPYQRVANILKNMVNKLNF